MLEECAEGFDIRRQLTVTELNGTTGFPDIPKFDDIQIGHIRKMVRHLGINKDCAKKHGCY